MQGPLHCHTYLHLNIDTALNHPPSWSLPTVACDPVLSTTKGRRSLPIGRSYVPMIHVWTLREPRQESNGNLAGRYCGQTSGQGTSTTMHYAAVVFIIH